MTRWIGLFCGLNVGGHNRLPMTKLVKTLESMNLSNARTYIQSGNIVFQTRRKSADRLAVEIGDAVQTDHGIDSEVQLFDSVVFDELISVNPFADVSTPEKTVHFFFLKSPASASCESLIAQKVASSESCRLTDRVCYLHAPDGIGRSKLVAALPRILGVPVTARNLRTVLKLAEMAAPDTTP